MPGSVARSLTAAGVIAFPPDPIYTATKHAVVGFVRSLAPVLAASEIACHAVLPGVVDTNILARGFADQAAHPAAADFRQPVMLEQAECHDRAGEKRQAGGKRHALQCLLKTALPRAAAPGEGSNDASACLSASAS